MLALIIIIFTAALFDSISTMQQILVFIWLLSTGKPVRNSSWFLVGLVVVYLLCGCFGYLAIHQLNDFLQRFFPNMNAAPDGQFYPAQLMLGIMLFVGGIIYYFKQAKSQKNLQHHALLKRLKNINPIVSFLMGGFISISGFPFALPYLAVLEKISLSGLNHAAAIGLIGWYNFVYTLPMLLILAVYLFFQYHVEDIEKTLHLHAIKWNKVVNILLFSGMGFLMMVDSLCFMLFSHPLFINKLF